MRDQYTPQGQEDGMTLAPWLSEIAGHLSQAIYWSHTRVLFFRQKYSDISRLASEWTLDRYSVTRASYLDSIGNSLL